MRDPARRDGPIRAGAQTRCRRLLAQLIEPSAAGRADLIAAALIDRFGTLNAVLAAPRRAQQEVLAAEPAVRRVLGLLRRTELHLRRQACVDRPMLGNWTALLDYMHALQAHGAIEELRVLFLNTHNILIRDEVMWRGDVDQAPLFPRQVMKRCLDLGAVAVILVHNHPSGDPKPSRNDIATTRLLVDAGKALGVTVHDHIVIASQGHSSMRSLGLL